MRIRTKIFMAFMTLTLLIFILGGAGAFYLVNNNNDIEDVTETQDVVLAFNDAAFQTVRANAAIRGFMMYEEDYMLENHLEIRETLHSVIDDLQAMGADTADFSDYLTQLNEWETGIDEEIIPLIENGDSEQAMEVSKPILGEGSTNLVMFSKEMANEYNEQSKSEFSNMLSNGKIMMTIVITMSVISVIISILLTFTFGRRLSDSIHQVIDRINVFATGNFNVDLHLKSNDEFGELSKSFNQMAGNLRETMHDVSDSSAQVAAMSEQFNAGSAEVSQATNQITDSITSISDNIEEQNEMTNRVGSLGTNVLTETKTILQNVDHMRERVDHTDEVSEKGLEEVREVNEQMGVILNNSEQITADINELNEQTRVITDIIVTIKEIAEQTNLLALNASIEAARAGESGQGFAVVADEVRKLAEESNNASISIEEVIHGISNKIQQTVKGIEHNNDAVKEGQTRVMSNGEVFDAIIDAVATVKEDTNYIQQSIHTIFGDVEKLVAEIEATSELSQQSNDRSQGIASASQQQSASMEEVAEASTELSKLAVGLQELIQQYKY